MTEIARVSEVTAVVTKFAPKADSDVILLHERLFEYMLAGARAGGFWSGDILTPAKDTEPWKMLQRFTTFDESLGWSKSPDCKGLLAELAKHCSQVSIEVVEDLLKDDNAGVTTAIITDVKPGMEEDYFAWESKIHQAQAKFPGYRGIYIQPPGPGRKPRWATLLRFDSPANLQNWFDSKERLALLAESEKFVKDRQIQHVSTSFPGWVGVDPTTGNAPANWKTAMLVLLGLFPVVMLEVRMLNPFLTSLPPVVASFISMLGSVASTTFVTMPLSIKAFGWWLFPRGDNKRLVDLKGFACVSLIYLAEIMLFKLL
jgi:antibiotic biosynthesis monooxygenase (ABM) superfamily enzyme